MTHRPPPCFLPEQGRPAKPRRITGGNLLLLIVVLFQTPAMADEKDESELVRMFAWWNDAITKPEGFTIEAFSQHFTDDAAIIVNNEVLVRGISNMVPHFRKIQENTDSVEIVLPFEEEFREGNRIFTYHRIKAVESGKSRESHVMGYAVIRSGKIELVNFVSYTNPAD